MHYESLHHYNKILLFCALSFYFWNFQITFIDSCSSLMVNLLKIVMKYISSSFVQTSKPKSAHWLFCILVNERNIWSCWWRSPNIILVALFSNLSNFLLFVSGMNKNAVLQYVVTGCTIALYRSRAACIVSIGRIHLNRPSLLDASLQTLWTWLLSNSDGSKWIHRYL